MVLGVSYLRVAAQLVLYYVRPAFMTNLQRPLGAVCRQHTSVGWVDAGPNECSDILVIHLSPLKHAAKETMNHPRDGGGVELLADSL